MTASQSTDAPLLALLEVSTPDPSAELADVENRLEVVRALADALARRTEVSRVVQSSANVQGALQALRAEPFGYSDQQARAVLALAWSAQTAAEVERTTQEMQQLLARRASLREHLTGTMALHWFG